MKFLFDHNLSPRLVKQLSDIAKDSAHVYDLGMAEAEDTEVWNYAKANNYMIVTRDSDYNDLLILRGFPPKIIWIRRRNCSTSEIERILRLHLSDIQTLASESTLGILILY